MREEFKEIISGCFLIDDVEVLGEYIEETAKFKEKNGLELDEEKYVELMVKTQINKGIQRGDFDL